jgi:adenine deaminase
VQGGVAPARAVRHATLVPARHYGLADRGAVAPGYRADCVVVEDLEHFQVHAVIKDGVPAAREGRFLGHTRPRVHAPQNTIHLRHLEESAFRLKLSNPSCPVIHVVPDQITNRLQRRTVKRIEGCWAFDPEQDVALVASIERHRATGQVGLGLVSGFGLRRAGALGSSVAHDAHNLIIAGTNARDMLLAAEALAHGGGGWIVVADGAVAAQLPLPVAGLISAERAEVVCEQLGEVHRAAQSLGCSLTSPFGTLSFLALPVIPELRITTKGLFHVPEQQFVRL